jgi:hypothetical protein
VEGKGALPKRLEDRPVRGDVAVAARVEHGDPGQIEMVILLPPEDRLERARYCRKYGCFGPALDHEDCPAQYRFGELPPLHLEGLRLDALRVDRHAAERSIGRPI